MISTEVDLAEQVRVTETEHYRSAQHGNEDESETREPTVVAATAALERAGRSLQETRYRLEATLAAIEERSRRLSMAMAALEQRVQRLAVRPGVLAPGVGFQAPLSDGELPANRILTEAERRQLDRENILAALEQTGGKVSGPGGAAELLGLKHTTLASRIKALGIERAVLRR